MSSDAPDSATDESSPIAFLYRAFDDMIAVLGQDQVALADARSRYEDRRGRVFEDEDLWEDWSQAFLEWYALEAAPNGLVPAAGYLAGLRARAGASSDGDAAAGKLERTMDAVRAWLNSHRSLFEIRALRAGRVELLDVLGGGWFAVAEQRAMAGVSVGDVAELRLVGFSGDVRFGRTFVFHPPGTRDAIIKHATRVREQGGSRFEIMDLCATLRIRCVRYRHVAPRRVYESSPVGPVEGRADAGRPAADGQRVAADAGDAGDPSS